MIGALVSSISHLKQIVAKADQLVALVDELEAQQTRSDALVAELTAARAPEPVMPVT